MMNGSPTTMPPSCSTSSAVAFAVPPVARTSSCTSTRWPGLIASACTSSWSKPYSSPYFAATVCQGGLPGFGPARTPAEPARERAAGDVATRLGAEDEVRLARRSHSARRSTSPRGPSIAEQRHDALEDTPGFGKSGTSRIFALEIHRHVALPRRDPAQRVPQQQLREFLCGLTERAEVLEALLVPLGVPRAQRRRRDLSSRPAARSAVVRNVRRCRAAFPRRGGRTRGRSPRPAPCRTARRRAATARSALLLEVTSELARDVAHARIAQEVDLRVVLAEVAASSASRLGASRVASSWRITRSGRNSSRWKRRIDSSRRCLPR